MLIISIAYINYFIEYDPTLINVLYSIIILLAAYIVSSFIEKLINRQVHEAKERYSIRKVSSAIISIFTFAAILTIWFEETTSLVIAYGIFGAGVAIALQDVIKKLAGGIIIVLIAPFKAGDQIQVENDGDYVTIIGKLGAVQGRLI